MKPSELLSGPEKWTKSYFARDANLVPIPYSDPGAFCFCLRGALYREGFHEEIGNLSRTIRRLFPYLVSVGVSSEGIVTCFNDAPDTTFEDVQKVLKEAGL
jgi:hypothetical protein